MTEEGKEIAFTVGSSSAEQRHEGKPSRKRHCMRKDEQVEQCLAGFFRQVQGKGVSVTDESLIEK